MAATTPIRQWPYPTSDDLIANGATQIGNLANAIESTFVVATNKYGSGEPYTSWPQGMSTMGVNDGAGALAWPYNYGVLFSIAGGAAYTWQLFFGYTAQRIWARIGYTPSGGSATWYPWRNVSWSGSGGGGLANAQASGAVSLTPPANGVASATVTFPANRFTAFAVDGPVRVTVSNQTTAPNICASSVYGVTSTSFTAYMWRTTASATLLYWQATQGLEPPE